MGVVTAAENGMAMHLFSLFTPQDTPHGDSGRSARALAGQLIFGVRPY
jgi:hypothetical protein